MAQQNSSDKGMVFLDHVEELRARFVRALLVFFVGFITFYFVSEPILAFLRRPLFHALPPEQQKLYFTSLFENFLTHLKIAGYASLFVLCPYYFYEIWAFVAPGLHERERKMALPFISAAASFFVGGAAFAYFVLFPVGFKYFISYGGPSDVPLLTIASYYDTCLKLMTLFGLAFELPVVICFLGFLGLIDAATLRKQRRFAVMGIAVASALFAPPDAMSMIMLAVPLYLMYEGSIWVVQWLGVRRSAALEADRKAREEAERNALVGQSKP